MEAQYIAHWLNGDGTETLAHPDLPLSDVDIIREVGVGRLTATLPPELLSERGETGRRIMQEWGTAIYVVIDGELFDAFIVADVIDDEPEASIDCVGWLGYLSGFPYEGNYYRRNVPARDVITEITKAPSKFFDGADVGFSRSFSGALPYMGNPEPGALPEIPPMPDKPPPFTEAQPKRPKYPKNDSDAERKRYDKAMKKYEADMEAWYERQSAARELEYEYQGKVRERESAQEQHSRVLDDAAYKMNWAETPDMLREFQSVLAEIGAGAKMLHSLDDPNNPLHRIEVFTERRRVNRDAALVEGDNVLIRPKITEGTDDHAKTVIAVGAGDGTSAVRSTWAYQAGGDRGLQRVYMHVDKSVTSRHRVSTIAEQIVRQRRYWREYDSFTVINSALAPVGDIDVGDEVEYVSEGRRAGEYRQKVLVTRISLKPATGQMEIGAEPIEGMKTIEW